MTDDLRGCGWPASYGGYLAANRYRAHADGLRVVILHTTIYNRLPVALTAAEQTATSAVLRAAVINSTCRGRCLRRAHLLAWPTWKLYGYVKDLRVQLI